jgi:hypothetical protein
MLSFIRLERSYASMYVPAAIFIAYSLLYIALAWAVCGGERWWVLDYIDGSNVFYGDDAYRFFLARSAWLNGDLYTYNFALPGFLVLDGAVVSIAGGDVFFSRCIHALLAATSLALIWGAGRILRIEKYIMMVAMLVIGLLPRFAFTSLSFYGEAWLGFVLCGIIFFFLYQRYLLVAMLASLLPLIRPEGMFFWVPLWLYMVKARSWSNALIMLFPGFLYFVYLNLALPSFSDYGFWRLELRNILNKLVLNRSFWDWLDTYSLFLVIPALLGWFYPPLRALWPVLLGAAIWFAWLIFLMFFGYSDYEDRYTFILIPVMALLWSGFFQWLKDKFSTDKLWGRAVKIVVAGVAFIAIASHFSNMYMIKGSFKYVGIPETLQSIAYGRWGDVFMFDSAETIHAWKDASAQIEYMLADDREIKRLVVFDHVFYYFLNPKKIPEDVVVGYATNGYRVFHILFDGQVFAQHPGGKMYSYFDFSEPTFTEGEKRAIYVDLMPLSGYPYTWKFAGYEMHLFAYKDSLSPRKSLENAPMIDLDLMKKAYEKWW